MAPTPALAIGKIEDADKQLAMTTQAIEGKMSRAEVENAVQQASRPKRKPVGKGGSVKGKVRLATKRTFKYEAGLKITVERAKGIDPTALLAALEQTAEAIRGEVAGRQEAAA